MTYHSQSSHSHTSTGNEHAEDKHKSPLSRAASTMRNPNATPEERRQAAALLGRQGGIHSHDNDPGKQSAKTPKKLEDAN